MVQRQTTKLGYVHWNTPAEVLDPLREFLPITLDPCSNPGSIVGADVAIELPVDGLAIDWHAYGHTFVNPPYDLQLPWLVKAAAEYVLFGATVTALIPSSTETLAFREYVFGYATAVAFWKTRLKFMRHDRGDAKGGNTLPSALVYYGDEPERFADHFQPYATVCTQWQ